MTVPGIATAADYSEAIGVARRAKSVVVLLLLLALVLQVAAFFLLRYNVIEISSLGQAADAGTRPQKFPDILHYLTGLSLMAGIVLGIVLALVLYLIAHIMLVGRLIGVGKVTGSLIWAFILVLLLFPWQTFMNNASLTFTDWRVPGVLWTWGELISKYNFNGAFTGDNWNYALLGWFRFVGAPLLAIILLLIIQLKSNRGIRMAMGEDEVLNRVMGGETV
jgi:hypothetical protein